MKKLSILVVFVAALLLVGCDLESAPQSVQTESKRVEEQQRIYTDGQPAPFFDWSLERHLLIELYEARNNAVNTWAYVRNLNGQVIFECQSIGFPIPADTQLTNPEQRIGDGYEGEIDTLPQPEPNGLWTSPNTKGTFVFCLNDDGTVTPSYFESDVETHMARLNESGRGTTGEKSLKIQTNQ